MKMNYSFTLMPLQNPDAHLLSSQHLQEHMLDSFPNTLFSAAPKTQHHLCPLSCSRHLSSTSPGTPSLLWFVSKKSLIGDGSRKHLNKVLTSG
jgi:hypothetical protein